MEGYRIQEWYERALAGLDAPLLERGGDLRDRQLKAPYERVGELTMNESSNPPVVDHSGRSGCSALRARSTKVRRACVVSSEDRTGGGGGGPFGGGKKILKLIVKVGLFVFFRIHGMRRNRLPGKDQVSLVDDVPFNHLAFDEVRRFGDGRGEVDVPLIGSPLSLYLLNFRWMAHDDSCLW